MRKNPKSFWQRGVYYRISSTFELGLEHVSVVESMFKSYEEDMDGFYKGKYSYYQGFTPMYYIENNHVWKLYHVKPWYWDFLRKIEDLLWN